MQITIKTSVGDLNGLHYHHFPGRPTIVFLHESLGCAELWRKFPEQLGSITNCNVLIYDRLGYGKSGPFKTTIRSIDYLEIEADILLEVLESCTIDDAILFGHSDGGSIALLFGAMYPSKALGIITEGAHIFFEEEGREGIRHSINAYANTDLKARLTKYHGDKTDNVFWIWANTCLSNSFGEWNIEHYMKKITCPVLVIQGEKDEYGTLKQVEGIISQVQGVATKLVLPDIKHTPHKEASEAVLETSKGFIVSVLSGNQPGHSEMVRP